MTFEDKIVLDFPRPKVWDLLLDVNRFAACMPGVEQVTQIDDRTFDGVIQASVGPMTGKFSFRANIVESEPPRRLVLTWARPNQTDVSRVTFDIEDFMGSARLTVTHCDLSPEMLSAISGGWPAVLSSLKSLLETGQALAIKMAPPERMLAALKEMGIGTP